MDELAGTHEDVQFDWAGAEALAAKFHTVAGSVDGRIPRREAYAQEFPVPSIPLQLHITHVIEHSVAASLKRLRVRLGETHIGLRDRPERSGRPYR
jgi:hypothetical protein